MDTTKLIVEYLIVGILVLLGFIFFSVSLLAPDGIQFIGVALSSGVLSDNPLLSAIVFLPVAYGVGVVVEYGMLTFFDKKADSIKSQRLDEYLATHPRLFKKSPILKDHLAALLAFEKNAANPVTRKQKEKLANMLYGEMRTDAMKNSPPLYAEIDSHLNRLRILRALPLAETFFFMGVLVEFFRSGFAFIYAYILFFLVLFMWVNWRAVSQRQERYARAIERAHVVLVEAIDEKRK